MKVKQLDWIGDIEEDEEMHAEGLMGNVYHLPKQSWIW